jgi:four helix bundle protein
VFRLQRLETAYGSLMEVVSRLRVSLRQCFVSEDDHNQIYRNAEELVGMLSGLRKTLIGRSPTSDSGL